MFTLYIVITLYSIFFQKNNILADSPQTTSVIVLQSANKIQIGDSVTFAIKVYTSPQIDDVQFPYQLKLTSDQQVNFNVYPPETIADGRLEWRIDYIVHYYNLGDFDFPSIQINAYQNKNNVSTIQSEPQKVYVESLFQKDEKIELKKLKSFHEFKTWSWLYVLLFFLFISLAILLVVIFLMLRTGVIHIKKRTLLSPLKEAQLNLEKLIISQLKQEDLPHYYFQLTHIFKRYLERSFEIPALEYTSTELIKKLKKNSYLSGSQMNSCNEWLQKSDRIKFSDYRVSEESIIQDKQFITTMIHFFEDQIKQKDEEKQKDV